LLFITATHLCYGQYLNNLYDYDSTYDWGYHLFVKSDSSYFILGGARHQFYGEMNMHISADGNIVLNRHIFKTDSADVYDGNPGEAKKITNGFISPLTIQFFRGTYDRSWAGFVKYDTAGNVALLKTYTDTSAYFETMQSCAVLPDGGYLIGGLRELNRPSLYQGLLIRTDSLGDTLWTRTYQKIGSQKGAIVSIIPLTDGRIIIGAMSTYTADAGGVHHLTYYHNTPWFMLLDSSGAIIRDTLFSSCMVGGNICGSIYTDKNGGYIHIGSFDSLFTEYPDDWQNFPSYVAHLDSNFRVNWLTELPFSFHYGRRGPYNAHQLQDGNFIVNGEVDIGVGAITFGWAAKIEEQTGKILWNHIYYSDTNNFAYLTDMKERPDGSLVFVGKTFNDTCATWRDGGDVWLLAVDSNGCMQPGGCDPDTTGGVTAVPIDIVKKGPAFRVWPNPTNGRFTIHVSSVGNTDAVIIVTDIFGKKVKELSTHTNRDTEIQLNAPPGIYFVNCTTPGPGSYRACEKIVVQ
jgi:hypothetical protein